MPSKDSSLQSYSGNSSRSGRVQPSVSVASPDCEAPASGEVERVPSGTESYFGDSLLKIQRYVQLLVTEGLTQGLIGPREPGRIWSRHILNCCALLDLLPQGSRVADVGSGAGLPGLVLAIARPDLQLTLIESMQKRCRWLEAMIDQLDLCNVSVVNSRAEDLKHDFRFPFLTARAVGNLSKLVPWTAPLVTKHGSLLFLKGEAVQSEIDQGLASGVFLRSHLQPPQLLEVATPVTGESTYVVKFIKK